MTDLASILPALGPRTREHLERLRDGLREDLGDELVGMLVFGSAVRGNFDPDRSDVDVVVALRTDSRGLLERIGPKLELARRAARIETILLVVDELPRAADVFPLFYDDIQSRNVVVTGKDPFVGLEIHDHHRRLRIEQELRDARIRLRRVVTEASTMRGMLGGAVERKLKQLRGPLHALLRIRGRTDDDGLGPVLAAAGQIYGVDVRALERPRDDAPLAYDTLVRLLDAAIADVDTLTEGGPS